MVSMRRGGTPCIRAFATLVVTRVPLVLEDSIVCVQGRPRVAYVGLRLEVLLSISPCRFILAAPIQQVTRIWGQ